MNWWLIDFHIYCPLACFSHFIAFEEFVLDQCFPNENVHVYIESFITISTLEYLFHIIYMIILMGGFNSGVPKSIGGK